MNIELNNVDPNLQKKYFGFFKATRKNIIAASLLGFITIMLLVSAILLYQIFNRETIYKGVYINHTYVGNMTVKQAESLLTKKLQDKAAKSKITVTCKDTSESISLTDLHASYKVSQAVEKAYSVGRNGNFFEKLYDIFNSSFNNKNFNINVSYNKQKVDDILNSLYNKTLVKVSGPQMYFSNQAVKIRSGHHGENMDKSYALKGLIRMISNCEGGTLSVPMKKANPQQLDVADIYKKITVSAKDAALKVVNNKVTIEPEVIGRTIDKAKLEDIISELNKKEDTEEILPVSYIYPKETVESLNKSLFKDNLNTFYTVFNQNTQNNRNRVVNMRLAVAKINNVILAPGQVFSFNDIVGDRTASLGYKTAITYANGKLVEGIGGGLCQVSTTLYNAVLRSDLKIVSRYNHSFIVTYVPLGMDATVSYGSVDFKFMNSTKWPLKINCWTTGSRIYFSLTGTNENPKKTVEVSSKIIKTIPYKTVYINDPTLPAGKTNPVPRQEGHTGYIVDTYKTVKIDGKVISNGKIYTSSYRMLNEEILRGANKTTTSAGVKAPATVKQPVKPATPAVKPPATTPQKPSVNNTPKPTEGVNGTGSHSADNTPQAPSAPDSSNNIAD